MSKIIFCDFAFGRIGQCASYVGLARKLAMAFESACLLAQIRPIGMYM